MLTQAQAKLIRKLKSRKPRERSARFLVEGVRLFSELTASEHEVDLVVTAPCLTERPRGRELLERIRRGGWPHTTVSDAELRRLADTETPQGVLAIARRPPWELQAFDPAAGAAVLVFDGLADPGNLGTLLRTAYGLGVAWAVALPGTVDPWNPKAVRASAGSVFHLPVSQEPWPDVLAWLRGRRFEILCADPVGEPIRRGESRADGFALVLGSEAAGLSEEVSRACSRRVAVGMRKGMGSLNVAVAGALLLDRLLAGSGRE